VGLQWVGLRRSTAAAPGQLQSISAAARIAQQQAFASTCELPTGTSEYRSCAPVCCLEACLVTRARSRTAKRAVLVRMRTERVPQLPTIPCAFKSAASRWRGIKGLLRYTPIGMNDAEHNDTRVMPSMRLNANAQGLPVSFASSLEIQSQPPAETWGAFSCVHQTSNLRFGSTCCTRSYKFRSDRFPPTYPLIPDSAVEPVACRELTAHLFNRRN
jgi:hypothetical protein